MDIVIGYQGKDHVKAEQLRRLITGLSGAGTYVLDTQNKLAASMVTANQVRIDTGDIVAAGGAYATVETPETLIIESGATGQKRIDLVVARYEKEASTSVESMELAVVKGTPVSYGDAADPEVQEGSIIAGDSPVEVPLWRIPIDGLAPGTPEQLFETIPSIDALRDSVSQATGVEKITLSLGSGTVSCTRCGRVVTLSFFTNFSLPTSREKSADIVSGLPKPARVETGILIQQESFSVWYAHVDTDGVLRAERKSPSGGGFAWYVGHFCYIADDAG